MTSPPSAADFYSGNCLREVDFALEHSKPLILVHEKDEDKGWLPLANLRADCKANGRDASRLFDEVPDISAWHRVSDYQQLRY